MHPEEKLASREFDLKLTYTELEDLTPILYASKYGIVDFIVANVSKCSEDEKHLLLGMSTPNFLTALHYSCLYGRVKTAKILIEQGAPILKASSLQLLPMQLIFSDHNDILSCVALFNVFPNPRDWITKTTSTNENFAHLAATKGATEILKVIQLIEPTLLDAKDNHSLTPLLRAVLNNQFEAVDYLLHHSKYHLTNSKGQTALHIAVSSSSVDMMKVLLPYFDSHVPDNENCTALELAKKLGYKSKEEAMVHYYGSGSGYVRK